MPARNTQESFWRKVEKGDRDKCWPWKGSLGPNGYGQVSWSCKQMRSHRLAWILTFGEIPNGLQVQQTCGNKICCNPGHLEVGSTYERSLRREAEDPSYHVSGSRVGTSELKEDTVIEIVRSYIGGAGMRDLARENGVHHSTIGNILRGETWSHITGIPKRERRDISSRRINRYKRETLVDILKRNFG